MYFIFKMAILVTGSKQRSCLTGFRGLASRALAGEHCSLLLFGETNGWIFMRFGIVVDNILKYMYTNFQGIISIIYRAMAP